MKKEKKSTGQVIHEYGESLTRCYLVILMALLPLYYQDGYANIANAKYVFYRAVTIGFIVLAGGICFAAEMVCNKWKFSKEKLPLPITFLIIFLALNLLSYIFSTDMAVSWLGKGSWHMGLLTQIMFIVSMLLICFYYKESHIIWIAAGVGAGITGILTVLNRFDIYPLDMGNKYPGFISTLGQTNWATMYMSCLMGAGIGLYIFEQNFHTGIIILIVDICIFMGAWVVGSDTILPVIMVELFVLFGVCVKERRLLERFVIILATIGVVSEIVYVLVFRLFHEKFVFVDENDAVNTLLKKHIGIMLMIVSALIFAGIICTGQKEWNRNKLIILYRVLVTILLFAILITITAMVVVTNYPEKAGSLANIRFLNFDYDWGTHRGLNWRCAVGGFLRMSPFRMLVGVGQGGFAGYIYSFDDYAVALGEMYGKYKLMVAHNEYLNFIIENGIPGFVSYAGFIVSSFAFLWKRADKHRMSLVALLSLSGYFACSLFFFQHVYATSFMYVFVAMALSESRIGEVSNS
ncbi:O-antigen ligase family protein [Butyrivibrio sp. JL13D10]|uniref:O-antigen ligase family protein n=1 Tax=Butyrivibrio sp. JL13D10 TaxID=3236815 RepID=UPI0038B6107C